jgi:hypothetical protein
MMKPFLRPFSHLLLDDTRIDPVATWRQDLLGDLRHETLMPALPGGCGLRTRLIAPAWRREERAAASETTADRHRDSAARRQSGATLWAERRRHEARS